MQVTAVRSMRLTGPDPHGIGGVPRQLTSRLVRVDTDEGVYGVGEMDDLPGAGDAIARLAELLVGRDPLQIRPFVTEWMYGGMPPHDPWSSFTSTPTGPTAWGLSGVESAFWDIAGKVLGAPVWQLLGGRYRSEVKIYLDRSSPTDVADLEAWRKIGRAAVADGFNEIKFDIDATAPDLTEDVWNRTLTSRQIAHVVERLGAVREAVGAEIAISVDCHMHYDVPSAIQLAEALQPLAIRWLEDPVPITSADSLADVRRASPIPICVGETFVLEQFRPFLERQAIDILHPDLLFCGGIAELRRVGELADLHYLPVAFHNNGGPVATLAAAHVAASTRNFLGLEYHYHDADWLMSILDRGGDSLFVGGSVHLTEQPGLGFELSSEACAKHLAPGSALFFDAVGRPRA